VRLQKCLFSVLAITLFCSACFAAPSPAKQNSQEPKYLLFQIFTYDGSGIFPPSGQLESTVDSIVSRIGASGDQQHKLGFCAGPLTFNHSDEQIVQLIDQSFQIARKRNVAVAFHIDDQMFWDKRLDLLSNKENVEWSDWKGKPNTARRLDWSANPSKAPPQMCLNSASIQAAIRTRAKLIGREIGKHLNQLKSEGKDELFAGVIAGWETMIGKEFGSGKCLGYHALKNRGYSENNPGLHQPQELAQVIRDHIELWAGQLEAQGIPGNRIYCHIAFTPQGFERPDLTYEQGVGFATPDVAFDKNYRPGFSTYPDGDSLLQIHSIVKTHGNVGWISAEGTNVVPNGMPGEPTMESYLAKMFNHGAVMVNIFSWGIGGERERNRNMFRRATESDEAISAYRKFLTGKPLKEAPPDANAFSPQFLRQKLDTIQRELPLYVGRTGRRDLAESYMRKLDGLIKSNKFIEANAFADEVIKLLAEGR